MSWKNFRQTIRPWIYFTAFIAVYGALSTRPDLEDYVQYTWFAGLLILSVICLWRWFKDPNDPRYAGLGISRWPLPQSWKRWMYDERNDSKHR
jgi:hypothetical protein